MRLDSLRYAAHMSGMRTTGVNICAIFIIIGQ